MIDPEKLSNFDYLNHKVNEVDERLSEVQTQSLEKFSVLREQVSIISKKMDNGKQKSDQLLDNKNHYIKILEQKIFERFDQESQVNLNLNLKIRKEIERKLFILIEDKFNALRVEISKESKNRFESIENLKNYLEVNFFFTIERYP